MFLRKRIPSNLVELLDERVRRMPERIAYRYPAAGGWGSMTWVQADRKVKALASHLLAVGVQPGDRVAIMSSTRVEWPLAAMAILSVGAAVVAIYPETGPEDVEFIMSDSGSSALFVENEQRLEVVFKGSDFARDLPAVLFDGGVNDTYRTFDEMSEVNVEGLARRSEDITGDTLATLIYTSGTTSKPKGVMLTHGNWLAEANAIDATGIVSAKDVEYYWLPFAHSFGMALLFGHLAIGFTKCIDGNPTHIVENLPEVKPTFMAGPPRTFEKILAGVNARIAGSNLLTRKLYERAMSQAHERLAARRKAGKKYRPVTVGLQAIVFGKVTKAFGGRMRLFVSGGAALSADVAEVFDCWGVPILQGYGLTETCGASTVTRYDNHYPGSVGLPLPGTQVRIEEPVEGYPDGEISLSGPHVMSGYFGNEEATGQVLDPDGWFHTGDLGRYEEGPDGQLALCVTGRLKLACKLSTGKYVTPEQIEVMLTATGYIAHAVVVAAGRKYVTALVSLDPDNVRQWAKAQGIEGDYQMVVHHPAVRKLVTGLVGDINARLNKWERIGRWDIVPVVFTPELGYLTPSNKVIRHAVLKDYGAMAEALYS